MVKGEAGVQVWRQVSPVHLSRYPRSVVRVKGAVRAMRVSPGNR